MRKCHAQKFRGEDSCDNEPKNKCELEMTMFTMRERNHSFSVRKLVLAKFADRDTIEMHPSGYKTMKSTIATRYIVFNLT